MIVSFRGLLPIHEPLLFGPSTFLMAPCGDYWKFMKKLIVSNLLGSQALERSRGIRAKEIKKFYSNLLDKAIKSETVEISKEAMSLNNNIIFKILMGRTSCSEEDGEAERARGLVIESFALFKKIFFATLLHRPLEMLEISLIKKDILNVSDRFDEFLEKILRKHEEEKISEHQSRDMMDVLLEASRDENADYKITRNHIKSFLIISQTTQWTMAEIMNDTNILERLKEEIDCVVGKSRLIQETDLPNLPYLQGVVKEGLRLHPPGPLLIRNFKEGCMIEPLEFKPERFLASSILSEQVLKYIPFGSGRRGCPGANLANILIGTAVGTMVQWFDWRIKGDKVNLEEAAGGMNLTMAHPLKCNPVARTINFLTSN
ncbi:hypothetical protein DY000_02020810 [Brassica cretica]|uniref:Cytochrome P450 n=1 Tax=Brassica cretica TaxID=69181 RepID=A0ABQ7E606_BRACR|nr:hypothetical protein DY000_02020810 [Brassica cretica]